MPGAEHHIIAHQQRRIHFGVAVFVCVEVKHELADRALQAGKAFLQDDKTCSAQFCSALEIHVAERAAEIVMRFWRERIIAYLAEHVMLHVAVLVCAVGHLVQRQIWDFGELFGKLFVRRLRG